MGGQLINTYDAVTNTDADTVRLKVLVVTIPTSTEGRHPLEVALWIATCPTTEGQRLLCVGGASAPSVCQHRSGCAKRPEKYPAKPQGWNESHGPPLVESYVRLR